MKIYPRLIILVLTCLFLGCLGCSKSPKLSPEREAEIAKYAKAYEKLKQTYQKKDMRTEIKSKEYANFHLISYKLDNPIKSFSVSHIAWYLRNEILPKYQGNGLLTQDWCISLQEIVKHEDEQAYRFRVGRITGSTIFLDDDDFSTEAEFIVTASGKVFERQETPNVYEFTPETQIIVPEAKKNFNYIYQNGKSTTYKEYPDYKLILPVTGEIDRKAEIVPTDPKQELEGAYIYQAFIKNYKENIHIELPWIIEYNTKTTIDGQPANIYEIVKKGEHWFADEMLADIFSHTYFKVAITNEHKLYLYKKEEKEIASLPAEISNVNPETALDEINKNATPLKSGNGVFSTIDGYQGMECKIDAFADNKDDVCKHATASVEKLMKLYDGPVDNNRWTIIVHEPIKHDGQEVYPFGVGQGLGDDLHLRFSGYITHDGSKLYYVEDNTATLIP